MSFSIIDYGKLLQTLLTAQRDVSTILTHRGEIGAAREFFVESVLKRFLPPSVVIGSGEIVDGTGKRSNQQDLLLYRSNFPVIDSLAGAHLYLAEGVLATIEVKSNLTRDEVERATLNIASVRALTVSQRGLGDDARVDGGDSDIDEVSAEATARRIGRGGAVIPEEDPLLAAAPERIYSYVFAFAGTTVETLIENARMHGWLGGSGPDCVCVVGSAFGARKDAPICPERELLPGEVFAIDANTEPLGWWLGHAIWAALNRPYRLPYLRPYL